MRLRIGSTLPILAPTYLRRVVLVLHGLRRHVRDDVTAVSYTEGAYLREVLYFRARFPARTNLISLIRSNLKQLLVESVIEKGVIKIKPFLSDITIERNRIFAMESTNQSIMNVRVFLISSPRLSEGVQRHSTLRTCSGGASKKTTFPWCRNNWRKCVRLPWTRGRLRANDLWSGMGNTRWPFGMSLITCHAILVWVAR